MATKKSQGKTAAGHRSTARSVLPKSITRQLAALKADNQRLTLAVKALDDATDWSVGSNRTEGDRDRYRPNRETILLDALLAWQENPLAKRIVSLVTQYVVGAGIKATTDHTATQKFIDDFWSHRLNRMDVRVMELCDELTRSGELYPVITTDANGMSYIRAIPAHHIKDIETADNDIEQETGYLEKPNDLGEARHWDAYDEATDDGQKPVMLHYAVNRPVGALHGESDLAPLLRWLARLSALLEDRVRLNRYRQSFLYIVRGLFKDDAAKKKKQQEINSNPPQPGSVLVTDAQTEAWGVLNPQLGSFEAGEDILAVKKMIGAGSGNPMHFLAEPEGSTRTTAESAGGPTYRHYQQRQIYFLWMVKDILQIVLKRKTMRNNRVSASAKLTVTGNDISARDNAALSIAATNIIAGFVQLYNLKLIAKEELLRLVYNFAGELVDVEKILAAALKDEHPTPDVAPQGSTNKSGDLKPTGSIDSGGDVTGAGAM